MPLPPTNLCFPDRSSISSRVKRRAKAAIVHNETDIEDGEENSEDACLMDIDGLNDRVLSPSKSLRNVGFSCRSRSNPGIIESSPTKIFSKTQRPIVDSSASFYSQGRASSDLSPQ